MLFRTDTLDVGCPGDHDKGLWLTVVLRITGVALTVIITTKMQHIQDNNSVLCSGNTFSETRIQRLQSGAPNENIVQNHLNIALLNVF